MKPGDVVADRFELDKVAGSGGMGKVFRARDRRTGGLVAVKVLWAHAHEDTATRFVREAELLEGLDHPGIVRHVAHGLGVEGEPWLALEWLEGETLAERLKRAGLDVAESVGVARRVAEALGVAHGAGIVHRDLKPANIFLVGQSPAEVRLLDFGIARVEGGEALTHTGFVIGTPAYMAPEQARGSRRIDARADVFALGCVLFHCLTGRPPFVAEEMHAALLKVVLEEAPRVSSVRSGVPEALDALVARMLAKASKERPADGAAVAAALAGLGIVGDTEVAETSARPSGLTGKERRVVSLVLTRLPRGERAPRVGESGVYGPTVALAGAETAADVDTGRGRSLAGVVERYGGRLDALSDGTLVVSLLSTGAATDQAARAARSALALREVLPEAPMALVAGAEVSSEGLPMGAVIERGVRLLGKKGMAGRAPPIRLDDVMAGLLDVRFDVDGDEEGLYLRGERELTEAARTLLGRPTHCVGRESELAILMALVDECFDEPLSRAAVILGPPGMGKSRLRHELLRKLRERQDAIGVWVGQGDPMSQNSPFALVGQMLRGQAGLSGGMPLDVQRQRLRARLGRHLVGRALERAVMFLGPLAGVPAADEESIELRAARRDPLLMGDQIRAAWEDLLRAETEERPAMLILEDLHWGDRPTVKLVDELLRALPERPIFVLALARPDLPEVFPRLWEGRPVQEIRLKELSKKAATSLVREVLGERISDEMARRLVERAGGNAFYLEELIRAAESGRAAELPETVLAMVEARLHALAPEARRLLRAGSVFGQVFWRGGAAALLGEGPGEASLGGLLADLCARELVVKRAESRFPAQEEYTFRHALVREAAYAALTLSDRALGHELAGAWLEEAGERDAVVLAEHYERGRVPARAAAWYRRAAEQALEGNDFRAAIERAEKAARGASGEARGELSYLQAEAYRWLGEASEAAARAASAMKALSRGSGAWYAAAATAASMLVRLGQREALSALAEEVGAPGAEAMRGSAMAVSAVAHVAASLLHAGEHAAAEVLVAELREVGPMSAQDEGVEARLYALHASRALCEGDPAGALLQTARSIPAFLGTGNRRDACVARVNAAHARIQLGLFAEAERELVEILGDARRLGLSNVAALAKQNLGPALAARGAIEEGERYVREAIADFAHQSNRRQEGRARIYLSALLLARGDAEAAEIEAESAAEALAAIGPLRAFALAAWARALLAQDNWPSGLGIAGAAMGLLASLGGMEEGEALLRLVYAEALLASGSAASGRHAIFQARTRLLLRANRMMDATMRESFLERVPENQRTMELGRELGA
ncbi:serine/threonine-protein kinase PknK [Polyangium spumosum]|uniref:non-specific serine/threonine protein kinase n=1 Tax=Polyangium spumosum TaxID=889282 RepID=A0A6N7PW83_9BACT|nr:serine/threonine-protein kinase [Polyangium spumosum]MRG95096.1 protein kinase [Polyangium spumosum]